MICIVVYAAIALRTREGRSLCERSPQILLGISIEQTFLCLLGGPVYRLKKAGRLVCSPWRWVVKNVSVRFLMAPFFAGFFQQS